MVPPDAAYVVDPADPRAPTEEVWARLSPEERVRVVGMLPPVDKCEAMVAQAQERTEAYRRRAEAAEARLQAEREKTASAEARLAEALAELEKLRGR